MEESRDNRKKKYDHRSLRVKGIRKGIIKKSSNWIIR